MAGVCGSRGSQDGEPLTCPRGQGAIWSGDTHTHARVGMAQHTHTHTPRGMAQHTWQACTSGRRVVSVYFTTEICKHNGPASSRPPTCSGRGGLSPLAPCPSFTAPLPVTPVPASPGGWSRGPGPSPLALVPYTPHLAASFLGARRPHPAEPSSSPWLTPPTWPRRLSGSRSPSSASSAPGPRFQPQTPARSQTQASTRTAPVPVGALWPPRQVHTTSPQGHGRDGSWRPALGPMLLERWAVCFGERMPEVVGSVPGGPRVPSPPRHGGRGSQSGV